MLISAITSTTLLHAFIWVVVAGVVYFLFDWALKKIKVDEPFNKVATVIIVLAVLIFLINALFTLIGKPFIPL